MILSGNQAGHKNRFHDHFVLRWQDRAWIETQQILLNAGDNGWLIRSQPGCQFVG
jgi:hypothetical protein